MAEKLSKLVGKFGTKGEGTLASKLGAAMGEQAITAEQKADEVFNKLVWAQERGGPEVFSHDKDAIVTLAKQNPKLSTGELENLYKQQITPPPPEPTVTALPQEKYKGTATPPPVTMENKPYSSTFDVSPPSTAQPMPAALPTVPKSGDMVKLKNKSGTYKVVGSAAGGALLLSDERNTVQAVKTEDIEGMEKEKPAEPVPPSGGTAPSVPPPDSSLADKISQGEKRKEVEQSDINKALTETLKLQQALGAGEKIDRSKLDGFLNELESIKIPERTSDPNAERFLQQRAEAYRAYQRKADRNEWLDLAQSLVNSITQFASAQAAMGTRFAGGQIPLAGVDYAGRTARAAKEYEMELGGVEAAERASAKKYEQDFLNEKDKMEGKKTGLLAKISAEKDALDEAQRTASAKQQQSITLFKLITDAKLEDAKVTATKNKLAQDVIADQKKQTKETVKTNINSLEDEAKKLQNQLAAANALAAGNIKDKDDNKVKLANALQLPVDTIETLISQQEGFFAGTKMQNYAKGIAADTQTKLTQINSSLNKLKSLSGEGAPATVTPPTPSTTPPPSGTVEMVDPEGRTLRVPISEVARLEALGAKRK